VAVVGRLTAVAWARLRLAMERRTINSARTSGLTAAASAGVIRLTKLRCFLLGQNGDRQEWDPFDCNQSAPSENPSFQLCGIRRKL